MKLQPWIIEHRNQSKRSRVWRLIIHIVKQGRKTHPPLWVFAFLDRVVV